MNNRKNWVSFLETSRSNIRKIMGIGRSVIGLLRHAHAAAHAKKLLKKNQLFLEKKLLLNLKMNSSKVYLN